MNKKNTIISIVILLALLAGAGIWKWKNKPQNITETQGYSQDLDKLKVYKNSKFHYSFKYPSDYNTYKINDGDGPLVATISTEEDEHTDVASSVDKNFLFGVSYTGKNDLEINSIKSLFGATNSGDIDFSHITIAGEPGFKLNFKKEDKSIISDFYFVKSPTGHVLEITVLINNSIARQIFDSLQFTD